MKVIPLKPYPGQVFLCESIAELREQHRAMTDEESNISPDAEGGCYSRVECGKVPTWLVWAGTPVALSHEFAHVLLQMCSYIGHDPTQGDGEPFCYMLSHLLTQAEK